MQAFSEILWGRTLIERLALKVMALSLMVFGLLMVFSLLRIVGLIIFRQFVDG